MMVETRNENQRQMHGGARPHGFCRCFVRNSVMDDARCFVVRFGRRLLLHEVYVLLHSIIGVSAHNNECFFYFSIAVFCFNWGRIAIVWFVNLLSYSQLSSLS